jgi:hypothetical protein
MNSEKSEDRMESAEASRRSFLRKAAKLAVYTPPAMLIMSQPSYATYQKTGGGEYQITSHHRHHRRHRVGKRFFGLFR